jgi:tetratricopeptide (TPR) repeat protein
LLGSSLSWLPIVFCEDGVNARCVTRCFSTDDAGFILDSILLCSEAGSTGCLMSFFRKLFGGSPLKQAKVAEAQGDLTEALRLYAENDAWIDVIRIQLRLAQLDGNPQERLNILRNASVCAERLPPESEPAQQARNQLARELLTISRAHNTETDLDRRLLEEAVRMGTLGGDFSVVGEALKALGRPEEAAQAFAQAGQIEQMESLYKQLESSRTSQNSLRDAFDMYELCMKSGARKEALQSIRKCVDLAPGERQYADLRAALEEKWLSSGVLPMRIDNKRVVIVGGFPADIGREFGCKVLLRDPSVSRTHAKFFYQDNAWLLQDNNSRNGTFLSGVRVASPLPLRDKGTFRLGEHATFEFHAKGNILQINCQSGLDRDTVFYLTTGDITIDKTPGVRFSFQEGIGHIKPEGNRVMLNGHPCAAELLPIQGDEISIGEIRVAIQRDLVG